MSFAEARLGQISSIGRLGRSAALESAGVAAIILLCALFLSSTALSTVLKLSLGATDPLVASGFYRGETAGDGRGFRWTNGDSSLILPVQGPGSHVLRLTLAAVHPTPLTITVDGRPALLADHAGPMRSYTILSPSGWPWRTDTVIGIQSSTFHAQESGGESRSLGVAVYDAEWRGLDRIAWLIPLQVALIALTLCLFALALAAARAPAWMRLMLVVMLAAILLAMRNGDTRFVYRWHAVLMTAGLCVFLGAMLVVLRRRPAGYTIAPARGWLAAHAPAFAGYAAVVAVMLAPLLAVFSTHILGPRGDNFEYVWKLQWFVDALQHRHVSPVFTPQIYYPAGSELTISEITPAQMLVGLPLTWLTGPIISYNALTILSFVLTASFTYLLALRLDLARGAAWAAGLIFAFCLERYFHVVEGHFGMMGSHWLALALYGWEGVLTRRRAWDALVAGVGLALVFWTSWHYGTTFPFIIAIYTLARCGPRDLLALLRDWRLIAIMATIVIPLVLPLAQPYVEARANGETYPHPYAMVLASSAAPLDYLRSNPYHPLWGAWAQQQYGREGAEFYVGLGYTTTALALAGIWSGRRRRITWALTIALLISLTLSLGPELPLSGGATLPLPAKWLHDNAPLLGEIRTWSRLAMYVAICGALLAGVALSATPRRWRNALCGATCALVLLEAASAPMLSAAEPRPVDAWLRSQPDMGAVAQIPKGAGGMNQFYSLFTGKPVAQGNGKYQPALYREERDTLYDFPTAPAIRLAQRWGLDFFVVIDAELDADAPGWRARLATQPQVAEVYRNAGYTVYRVRR
jgi:hypothetical protein